MSKIIKKFHLFQIFAEPYDSLNKTTDDALSPTMKEYYDTQLLENSRNEHRFAQFGKKVNLPKGRGKVIEWRKWKTIDPALTPLEEGITPSGQKLGEDSIKAEISQYGDWAPYTDQLDLHAFDDTILGATEEFAAAGAETQDLVVRNGIHSSADINVFWAGNGTDSISVNARAEIPDDAYLTSKLVNRIATILKKNKAPKINGDYVAIIHPSVAMDLRDSDGWEKAHIYAKPEEIFNGEIGRLHGVRFIESNNAKIYSAASKNGLSVYCTYFFGRDAWGVVDPNGAGMEMIVKPTSSGGADNPLNQRGSIGYKFSSASKVLYPERLICVETTSSFKTDDEAN